MSLQETEKGNIVGRKKIRDSYPLAHKNRKSSQKSKRWYL
jgi:hypothetical protein